MTGRHLERGVVIVFATAGLDALGVGLVMPILPGLLREVAHTSDLAWRFGAFLAVYPLMQFLCAPVLGSLSDRFGRRPVLLMSLLGAAMSYFVAALAESVVWLVAARAIAGVTGANLAVARAYLTDVTPEERRTYRFGQFNAVFGLGFVAGPMLGGFLGEISLRAPFVSAALLMSLNLIAAFLFLPESRTKLKPTFERGTLSPFASLRWAVGNRSLRPLVVSFVLLLAVGEVATTVWMVYGEDQFGWTAAAIGLSLSGFGLFHAAIQAFVAGPLTQRLGPYRALAVGVLADAFAYVAIAFAASGWVAFALLPIFCLGGVSQPALQSLLTSSVRQAEQGRLQGFLASLVALTSAVGPIIIAQIYFATRGWFPGLVWLVGAAAGLSSLLVLARPTASQAASRDSE